MGTDVMYPDVTVKLIGTDGNAFNLIGKVAAELRSVRGRDAVNTFTIMAMACESYDALLALIQRTVRVR